MSAAHTQRAETVRKSISVNVMITMVARLVYAW